MKKLLLILVTIGLALSFAACGADEPAPQETPEAVELDDTSVSETDSVEMQHLRVGVVGAFNIHWEVIRSLVAEDGIDLEIVYFSDFMTPNRALAEGDIDLNAFQHRMFLESDIAANGYEIEAIAETFISPLNLFKNTDRISTLEDLQDGHTVAIPSDPTNSGRALWLLEAAGLIVIDPNVSGLPTVLDIVEYVVDISIMEVESGMLPNILPDIEAAAINGLNALSAGLDPETQSIFREDIAGEDVSHLINVIAVRSADLAADELIVDLFDLIVQAHHSDMVRQAMIDAYHGALVPVW